MISGLWREAKRANASGAHSTENDAPERAHRASVGKLLVEYQPIVSARSGVLTGAEAIARSNAEPGVLAMPDFETAFNDGCANLARWQCCTPDKVALSIDISTDQLLDDRFVPLVARGIRQHAIQPARIRFEMREPAARDVTASFVTRLSVLRRMGIAVVLDDFGLKHSTLSSLIALPVSGLKFCRQFTESLPHDSTSAAILQSVVSLARDLGISVAVDGVENPSQLAWLARFGDLDAQGNLISGPLSSTALLHWLLRSPGVSAPIRRGGQIASERLLRAPAQ
ncbi:EAL domain-containing protein [Paraburkholderia acidiphila]|uniref:EAL domain-containing protein n=1 Tax=Paraburkholderia acidiphila TaxID=2571747 RepID=A0A7Z2JEH7_9BURK|nr:EAL domain-containing protein [Paraburkholderia acidiphila]QGZ60050.1 EAL domain-containing protein [Paraburkholderia acidiphila]